MRLKELMMLKCGKSLKAKAKSIEKFRKTGADVRTLEDIASGVADATEMKAEATGNPFILL